MSRCLIDCPINGECFRLDVEKILLPMLHPHDTVIVGNLGPLASPLFSCCAHGMATVSTTHRRLRIDPLRSMHAFPVRTHQINWTNYHPDRGNCAPMVGPPSVRVQYECLQCDEQWPGCVGPAECPGCGCAYVRWLNR